MYQCIVEVVDESTERNRSRVLQVVNVRSCEALRQRVVQDYASSIGYGDPRYELVKEGLQH